MKMTLTSGIVVIALNGDPRAIFGVFRKTNYAGIRIRNAYRYLVVHVHYLDLQLNQNTIMGLYGPKTFKGTIDDFYIWAIFMRISTRKYNINRHILD